MGIVHFNDLKKYKITKEEFEIFKKQTFQQYIDSINELLEPYYEEIKALPSSGAKWNFIYFKLRYENPNPYDINPARGGASYGYWLSMGFIYYDFKLKLSTRNSKKMISISDMSTNEMNKLDDILQTSFEDILNKHYNKENKAYFYGGNDGYTIILREVLGWDKL
jgi:hypothetical protein